MASVIKIVKCESCPTRFSFDTSVSHYKRFCPACAKARSAARINARNQIRLDMHARLVELGGPKFFRMLEQVAVRTREQTGKLMGCSKEQVRIVEYNALIKLMEAFKNLDKQLKPIK